MAGLRREGYDVTRVATGEGALEAPPADLVLLDLRLPDIDGLDVCRRLRERSRVPIIVVTARGEEADRVVGLELGADDYVVKPYGLRELIARIRAVMRRAASLGGTGGPLRVGELEVDERARRATLGGRELELTPKEFDLLAALARDPGAAVSRQRLLAEVWQTTLVRLRRRRSTSTSPRCGGSSATRAGSRPCAASASGCACRDAAAAARLPRGDAVRPAQPRGAARRAEPAHRAPRPDREGLARRDGARGRRRGRRPGADSTAARRARRGRVRLRGADRGASRDRRPRAATPSSTRAPRSRRARASRRGPRSRRRSPAGTRAASALEDARTSDCSTSRCRSPRAARCTARCGSRIRSPPSTRASVATG